MTYKEERADCFTLIAGMWLLVFFVSSRGAQDWSVIVI